MVEFLPKKVLADGDHDQANEDRAPDEHVHENNGLLKSTQSTQIEGREAGDCHTGNADEEGVDIIDLELRVASMKYGRRNKR